MNRKKKLTQIHKKRLKAAKAKGASKKKSSYISKAERAKLEEQQAASGTEAGNSELN